MERAVQVVQVVFQCRFIVNPTICKDSMQVQEGTEKAQKSTKLHQSSANKIERRLQN